MSTPPAPYVMISPETIPHVIMSCPALSSTRHPYIVTIRAILCEADMTIPCSEEEWCRLILDGVSSLNAFNNDILDSFIKITNSLCASIDLQKQYINNIMNKHSVVTLCVCSACWKYLLLQKKIKKNKNWLKS